MTNDTPELRILRELMGEIEFLSKCLGDGDLEIDEAYESLCQAIRDRNSAPTIQPGSRVRLTPAVDAAQPEDDRGVLGWVSRVDRDPHTSVNRLAARIAWDSGYATWEQLTDIEEAT